MYMEIEAIADYFMAWRLQDIKEFSVRERKHWYKRVQAKKAATG
jgi:hypothetical protein